MAEYIEKQAALKAVCNACGIIPDRGKENCQYKVAECKEYYNVFVLPPAAVRPVVRGRWINKERVGFGSVEAECSNCGRRMIFNNAWICCPWCMADMSGGDTE